ncbi:MAG: hypothetical protein Q4D37_05650 [Oscillospiraceae bacterium]|nr:hypothetical protein [Oscillospiraceae bacterium]
MKKKLIAALLAATCCCVAFTGCTSITSGTVVNKRYNEAYDSVWYWKTENLMIPQIQHHEAEYRLQLQDTIDCKVKTDWITVSEEVYNQYQISDLYP